ncbi:MAG TPA: type I restriction endonuclease [Planctomycetaceae bacterium]
MDFADRIRELGSQVQRQLPNMRTEEATKHALVMPFIAALGYNVFDPTEVTPELVADVGVKKGEKVDYAILRDGKPIILFECKHHTADLRKEHASQLYRYFSVTEARFGVLTNGIAYRFFSDLDAPNKMDSKPFFEFNLLDHREQAVEELKKFSKPVFDLTGILATASELKYTREIQRIIVEQLQQPSEEFVRFFASQIYDGRMTQSVKEQFASITQRALKQFINDQVNERIKSALGPDAGLSSAATAAASLPPEESAAAREELAVVTTADELHAFYIVKSILHGLIDTGRVAIRDVQSYCGILLDDNNRKPICRLHFNRLQKYIGLFDNPERRETRAPLGRLDDIYSFADRLRATVAMYDGEREPGPAPTAADPPA